MNYAPISDKEERLAKAIVDAAYAVHSAPGPGPLENVYLDIVRFAAQRLPHPSPTQREGLGEVEKPEFNNVELT